MFSEWGLPVVWNKQPASAEAKNWKQGTFDTNL